MLMVSRQEPRSLQKKVNNSFQAGDSCCSCIPKRKCNKVKGTAADFRRWILPLRNWFCHQLALSCSVLKLFKSYFLVNPVNPVHFVNSDRNIRYLLGFPPMGVHCIMLYNFIGILFLFSVVAIKYFIKKNTRQIETKRKCMI